MAQVGNVYWPFIVLTLGIAFLVWSITVIKVHAFIALMLSAIMVGVLSHALPGNDLHAIKAVNLTMKEFGDTAGKIAWVICLASIIGLCLTESGASDQVVRGIVKIFGDERAGWAIMVAAFFLSIPVFFDTVFFLLIPLAQALAYRLGKHYLYFVMALCSGAAITHSLVPPTPGPLIMVETLRLNLGQSILLGITLGLPVSAFGLLIASKLEKKYSFSVRESAGLKIDDLAKILSEDDKSLPSITASMMPVILPIALIALASLKNILDGFLPNEALKLIEFFGNKNIAMAVGAVIALRLMARKCNLKLSSLWKAMEEPIYMAGTIVLITSAGGAFGAMIRYAGVGEAMIHLTAEIELSMIIVAWSISAVLKFAQGSGTVAMITSSGIMASILGIGNPSPFDLGYSSLYIFAAIAFGSKVGSWMNDSAFWIVCKLSGFTQAETLKTWTVLLMLQGLFGLFLVLVMSILFPFGLGS